MKAHARLFSTHLLLAATFFLTLETGCTNSKTASQRADRSSHHGSMLTAEDIASAPTMDVWEMLAAHVPGVQYNGGDLRIRGPHTLLGSNEPLYVMDGVELTTRPILNRYDVEYIKVLKGPEASFYGVRGGNGVIVIKTKSQI